MIGSGAFARCPDPDPNPHWRSRYERWYTRRQEGVVSVEALGWALNVGGLSTVQRIVLVGIANHHGDGGSWPSVKTLARYACASERSVQYAIRELERAGLVVRSVNGGGTRETRSDRRPNRYDLPVYNLLLRGAVGCTPTGRGVQVDASRGEPGCTRTISEPSVITSTDVFTRGEAESDSLNDGVRKLSLAEVRSMLPPRYRRSSETENDATAAALEAQVCGGTRNGPSEGVGGVDRYSEAE